MPEYSDTPGQFPVPKGLGDKAEANLPGLREGTIHLEGVAPDLPEWIRPLLGEPMPAPGPDTFNFWWRNGRSEPMCLLALTPDQVRRTIDVMREWLAKNGG